MQSRGWATLRLLVLATAAASLSACETATPETVLVAPSLPAWPAAEQAEVAGELEACLDCDAIERALAAYISLRDAIRAVDERPDSR